MRGFTKAIITISMSILINGLAQAEESGTPACSPKSAMAPFESCAAIKLKDLENGKTCEDYYVPSSNNTDTTGIYTLCKANEKRTSKTRLLKPCVFSEARCKLESKP